MVLSEASDNGGRIAVSPSTSSKREIFFQTGFLFIIMLTDINYHLKSVSALPFGIRMMPGSSSSSKKNVMPPCITWSPAVALVLSATMHRCCPVTEMEGIALPF